MLPKPEKVKKTNPDGTSAEKEISPADTARQKRFWVILLIFLTIGLSSVFSLYNFFKNYRFSLPEFSPPAINVNINQNSLETKLKSILKTDYPLWKFTVQTNAQNSFFWSSDPTVLVQDFPTLASALENQRQPIDSDLLSGLPQGLKIIQYHLPSRCQLIIITPENQIYFDIGYPETSRSQLPQIISVLYWSLMKM